MTKKHNTAIIRLFILILLTAVLHAQGKVRDYRNYNNKSNRNHQKTLNRPSAQEIERKFRPYLEQRIRNRNGRRHSGNTIQRIEEYEAPVKGDYYALRRFWDELSPEFRTLYKQATNLSEYKDYDSFISPKGKFQIIYTTSGQDSVDVTDNFRYGSGKLWNTRDSVSNGVPDYVDEAAFALDSSYTMLVERFGFDEPFNAPDPNGNTDYYTVLIVKQPPFTYGITELGDRAAERGFRSYIEINNDWSGWNWALLGYDKNPYNAIRTTCSHELFHSVQYAMSWNVRYNVYIDDFPYAWSEGSAVLMEEIAFPEINDYLQYIDDYFDNPTITLLYDEEYTYLNSILFKYLYEKTAGENNIAFIKEMYDNNSAVKNVQFPRNLEDVSLKLTGKTWPEVLNGFHAESYFTGSRHKAGMFVTDSKEMESWQLPKPSSAQQQKLTVKPYGARFLWYTPQSNHPEEIEISFTGQTDSSVNAISSNQWTLSALVIEHNNNAAILPIYLDKNGKGEFTLAQWQNKKGVLLIATNGNPRYSRELYVKPENIIDTLKPDPNSPAISVYPNIVKLRNRTPIRIASNTGISDVKIYTADGKLLGYWNGASKNENFKEHEGYIEWTPRSAGMSRLTPGTYYVLASSKKTALAPKVNKKTKIIIIP